ncbi:hypothetical protein G6L37_07070 [Agrobacterium rubi]|nr:hypothetical protein [Agrobacterium rubi]NTF25127.1 hypothetical protein [Agrobacterium rubi]
MADVSKAEWVLAYQAAFKEANPQYELPVKVRHWSGGWYQIAFPGRPFVDSDTKITRKRIVEMTDNLRARTTHRVDVKENEE